MSIDTEKLVRLMAIGLSEKQEDKFIMRACGCKNIDEWLKLLRDKDKLEKLNKKLGKINDEIKRRNSNVIPLFKGK